MSAAHDEPIIVAPFEASTVANRAANAKIARWAASDLPRRISIAVERSPYGEIEAVMPPAPVTNIALHLTGQCQLEWTPDARPLVGRPTRGAMTIVPRGRSGRLRVSGGACEVLKIGIPDAAFAGWAECAEANWTGAPLQDRFVRSDPLVQQIGLTLLQEIERAATPDTLYRDALSNALVAHLVRSHSADADSSRDQAPRIYSLSAQRQRRCLEFLEADLARAIGLEEIARELGMSLSHFSAQFTQTFGRSPARYLTWLRLERARVMLETTQKAVGEIARAVGFTSVSHFSQAFRAEFGQTPTCWRACRG